MNGKDHFEQIQLFFPTKTGIWNRVVYTWLHPSWGSILTLSFFMFWSAVLGSCLSFQNYSRKLHELLYLEEFQMQLEIRRYFIPNGDSPFVRMQRDPSNKKLLILEVHFLPHVGFRLLSQIVQSTFCLWGSKTNNTHCWNFIFQA